MASGISIFAKALKINDMHIDRVEYVHGTAVMNGGEYRHDHIELLKRPLSR